MGLSSDQWKGTPLFCRFWMIVVYRCVAAALMQAIASDAAWQSGQSIGKVSYSRLCSLLHRGCAAVANLTANAKWLLFGVVFFFFLLLIFHSYFSFIQGACHQLEFILHSELLRHLPCACLAIPVSLLPG